MFSIIISEKGGAERRETFDKNEINVGRVQGNDLMLPKGNVSKRHARIVLKDGKFIIVDLKSTNGTYVNGRKITSPLVVKDSDKIYIGDFIVGVDESAADGDGPSETTTSPPGGDRLVNQPPPDMRPPRPTEAQPMASLPIPMNNAMNNMADPPPPAPVPAPRPGPPRPAPAPRDLPPREAPMARDADPPPGPPPPGRTMPPIAAPSPEARTRPPAGRPGGTMPPPMAPIPPIAAPQPAPAHLDAPPPAFPPPVAPSPAPTFAQPTPPPPAPPMPAPVPTPAIAPPPSFSPPPSPRLPPASRRSAGFLPRSSPPARR